jgi:hypothetical protein
MNPNDILRHQILSWFYERNTKSTSQYGKKGSAAKISDVKAGLKNEYGLTQQQVMSNLTYLIDKGWINRSEIEKTVRVKGGTIPSKVVWYEISSAGIDKIEGESEFKETPRYAGINISATGTNIITLGDGNVVNAQFADLHTELSNLKQAVAVSSLDESQKLDVSVDIESIKDQLAKASPDKTIIGRLWDRIEKLATIGGFIDVVSKVAPLIATLLPG